MYYMRTITINIDNATESEFRETVKNKFGSGKGILGKAVSEALNLWTEQKKQTEIKQRQLALMKQGFKLGKREFKTRADLHER